MKQTPFLLLGIGLVVWSCQFKTASPQIDEVPPQPGVFEYSCRGTEPFWLIEIYQDSIVYQRAGGKKILYPYRRAQQKGDSTCYTTKAKVYGKPSNMIIKIVADTCSDGMSDNLYPYKAFILRDGEVLHGCAISEPQD